MGFCLALASSRARTVVVSALRGTLGILKKLAKLPIRQRPLRI